MKKKILALCLVVVLAVTAVTGVTLAYFTDSTEIVENTFTVGGIDIDLDEAPVNPETGKEIEGDRVMKNEYKNIIPGQELDKDPTIHVLEGSQDCYVAATVTVTGADLAKILEGDVYNFYGIITGGRTYTEAARELTEEEAAMFDEGVKAWAFDNVILTQVATTNEGNEGEDKVVINYFIPEVKSANEDVALFENINIPGEWTNAEIGAIEDLNIVVKAYAAQAFEFKSCLEAMAATWAGDLHVSAAA